jgi:hypothetical protein
MNIYYKILFCLLFFVSLFIIKQNIFATTCGHNKSDVFGAYPDNYISVDCPSNKLYLIGNSRVQKIQQLPASALKAPSTNPAEYTELGLNGAFKFKKASDEIASCAIAIPFQLDKSTTPSIRIGFCSQDTSGSAIIKLEYLYRGLNEDISSVSADEVLYSTTTVSATSYGYVYANFTLLPPASTDKIIQMRITRMASLDTVTNDIFVIGLSLVYYINKLGE